MSKYTYAFFDFDGTLANSGPGIIRCVQYALSRYGIDERDMTELRKFIGPPLEDTFISMYGFTPEQADEAVMHYRSEYVGKGLYETTLYDGIEECLCELNENGIVCSVASNKPSEMITRLLDHFGVAKYIDSVSGLSDGVETKTQAIELLLNRYGLKDASRCVLVGDRCYDAQGAQNTKMDFVAAMYGFSTEGEFDPYPCVFKAADPREAARFILNVENKGE